MPNASGFNSSTQKVVHLKKQAKEAELPATIKLQKMHFIDQQGNLNSKFFYVSTIQLS
jgi:hypothetical protein